VRLVEDLIADHLDGQALAGAAEPFLTGWLLVPQADGGQVHQQDRGRQLVRPGQQRGDPRIRVSFGRRGGEDQAQGTQQRLPGQEPPRLPACCPGGSHGSEAAGGTGGDDRAHESSPFVVGFCANSPALRWRRG
jgi:hypothetical protein